MSPAALGTLAPFRAGPARPTLQEPRAAAHGGRAGGGRAAGATAWAMAGRQGGAAAGQLLVTAAADARRASGLQARAAALVERGAGRVASGAGESGGRGAVVPGRRREEQVGDGRSGSGAGPLPDPGASHRGDCGTAITPMASAPRAATAAAC